MSWTGIQVPWLGETETGCVISDAYQPPDRRTLRPDNHGRVECFGEHYGNHDWALGNLIPS